MDGYGTAQLRKEIELMADRDVYARGKHYIKNRLVGAIDENHDDESLLLEADVFGSRTYRTSLSIDPTLGTIENYSCTCPYDDFCKHMVALGLVFLEKEKKERPPTPVPDPLADIRSRLAAAGIDADLLSTASLGELARAATHGGPHDNKPKESVADTGVWMRKGKTWIQRASASPTIPPKPKPKPRKPFRERYRLALSPDYRGRINTTQLEKTNGSWNDPVYNPKGLLNTETDLTETERALIDALSKDTAHDKNIDFTHIIAAAHEAGIAISYGETSYGERKELAWRSPEKLAARIDIEQRISRHEQFNPHEYPYHACSLTLPHFNGSHHAVIACGETGLAIIEDGTITLHAMPRDLACAAVRAIEETWSGPYYYRHDDKHTDEIAKTDLTGEEYMRINEIIDAAREHCSLEAPAPGPFAIKTHAAKAVVIVDYRMNEQTLAILPSVDYGGAVLSVADTINRAFGPHGKITRRNNPAFGTTHVVRIDGDTVHTAPVDEKLERALSDMGARHGEALGLARRSRASMRGETRIIRYALDHLPALKEFAEKHGYEMRFPHDIPDIRSADFRADFDIDFNAANDWLAFDIALYCGDERVQLADVESFVEKGDSFLKMKDGRLLKITNPEAIERLIELLAHFRKTSDGSYEGRAFHAPGLDAMAKGSPHYTSQSNAGFKKFIKEAQGEGGRAVARIPIPRPFSTVMRPYQKDGVHWAGFLRRYRFGGILADDMGLGKTLQALAILSMHRKAKTPSIVIAPKTLLHNWQNEAERFAPHLRVSVIDGPPAERAQKIAAARKHDVVITSYPLLQKDIAAWEKEDVAFNYCVLDEAQYVKNPRTHGAHAVKRVRSDYRLALTGTPLENTVEELWSAFDFLMPGLLGTHTHFQKHFGNPIMKRGSARALEHLRAKTSAFMLRRTKEAVLKELPPKIEQTIECTLSDEQNILYQDVLARVRSDIFAEVKKRGFAASQIHILAGLTRLRQICNHPALALAKKNEKKDKKKNGKNGAKGKRKNVKTYPSVKLDTCMELVESLRAEGRKVLIFSQFAQMLDILADECKRRKIIYSYLTGKTRDRKGAIARFTDEKEVGVFLISTKAGGVGINLTAADAVIVFDPWWNPQAERQAVDRAHRIGQTKTVHVYRLRTKGTIEEKIAALQERKKKLFDALVGESKDLFKKITWDDVRGLLAG
ncbi:DEAD/DEAH box helicase [Candidatus Kaiserbacteria bacterium]|nr:DEAD/DEAH box helicase [Candidatus Kaiserbacteria bacterium]